MKTKRNRRGHAAIWQVTSKLKQKRQINKISRCLSAGEDKINLKC